MAKPFDPKEIVIVQKLAISNMLEIGALRELLLENFISGVTSSAFVRVANFEDLPEIENYL